MPDDELINPFEEIGPGMCTVCGGRIAVVDAEANYMLLDKKGYPTDLQNEYTRCEGVCVDCGARYPMKRSGLGYKGYSRTSEILREFEGRNKLQITKEPKSNEEKDTNPFIQK